MYDESSPYHDGESIFSTSTLCSNCGVSPPVEGPSKLCEACRQSFIKFPIPKWMWAFAAGIFILMILGFTRMGKYMSYSIHISRAEKAIEEHRYITAQKELQMVLSKLPNRTDLNIEMLIAACYNKDIPTVQRLYAKLENEKIADQKLMDEAQGAMEYLMIGNLDSATSMIITSAFLKDSVNFVASILPQIDTISEPLFKSNAYLALASICYDKKDYGKCTEVLNAVYAISPDNVAAMSLSAAICRNQGKFEEAIKLLQKVLVVNREDAGTISQLSRTELKRSNDKVAAELAQKAIDIAPENPYSLEALSMVQYYTGQKDKSFQTFAKIREIENGADSTISSRLYKIISGQEKYR
jgi:tetratricopeptide (TPR) repeat protein